MITEEYFKSKIDWKFFNYLKDQVTEFEDSGNDIKIFVCYVPDKIHNYVIYSYENGNDMDETENLTDVIINDIINNDVLYYSIKPVMSGFKYDSFNSQLLADEIYNRIKKRCKDYKHGSGSVFYVKPK